ncbi:MAG: UMP kinase [Bacilli bacterium]|nr:UMP kinase [Bacilli bacterium]
MYKKVILKLSGEALQDDYNGLILSGHKLKEIGNLIKELVSNGVNVGVVTGAGNIFRGRIAKDAGLDVEDGDYMGMTGTIINCKAISSVLNKLGVKNVLFSALALEDVAIKYDANKARKYLKQGYVCLFAGGIGKPHYTTDTCAATRAIEIEADAILAGKNGVDGVYTADPNKDKNAKFIKNTTYQEVLDMDLKVMDRSAIELLKNTNIVTRVFSMENIDNFIKVSLGDDMGTTIKE